MRLFIGKNHDQKVASAPVQSIFRLAGNNEDVLTYALGFLLARDSALPARTRGLRSIIFHRVRDYLGTFHADQSAYTEDYARLHTFGDILEPADYDTWWDEERTGEIIEDRLAEFSRGEFAEVDPIVVKCLKDYRAAGCYRNRSSTCALHKAISSGRSE